ncbi:hypothetical protein B0H14DRAFT_3492896 [Mycena olivaceomarginata]|nr:hypothetical protein B0H14DRAFT_3492896 [Mycena olivaceomarginata]
MRLPLILVLEIVHHAIRATQIPFQEENHINHPSWGNLHERPDANSTAHLIFDAVNSLLQHWPNTRYRNGHNMIPGTVASGTLLYHGATSSEPPTEPEWTATDPEHTFAFCSVHPAAGNESSPGCWHLTMVVTRTSDAQDLLIWEKVDPDRTWDERRRINDLCAWGKEFETDAYVRMEMDFEIMLCDFSQRVELLSADYLATWTFEPSRLSHRLCKNSCSDSPSDNWLSSPQNSSEVFDILSFEIVHAGSWHNRYPGEIRVALDLTELISFYDTGLIPSLISRRQGKERWDHRVNGISAEDLAAVRAPLEVALALPSSTGSGVDWRTLYRVVVDRYADRLEMLGHLLNTTTPENLDERAALMQTQLRLMLTLHILHTAQPTMPTSSNSIPGGAVTHGHVFASLNSHLTPSERLLLTAFDETNREICCVVVRMWAAAAPFTPEMQNITCHFSYPDCTSIYPLLPHLNRFEKYISCLPSVGAVRLRLDVAGSFTGSYEVGLPSNPRSPVVRLFAAVPKLFSRDSGGMEHFGQTPRQGHRRFEVTLPSSVHWSARLTSLEIYSPTLLLPTGLRWTLTALRTCPVTSLTMERRGAYSIPWSIMLPLIGSAARRLTSLTLMDSSATYSREATSWETTSFSYAEVLDFLSRLPLLHHIVVSCKLKPNGSAFNGPLIHLQDLETIRAPQPLIQHLLKNLSLTPTFDPSAFCGPKTPPHMTSTH